MMSLYNMLFGVNSLAPLLLHLLEFGENDVERFRDAYVGIGNNQPQIFIFTRTGGNNREGYPNEKLTSHPWYVEDFDDDFDPTYATFSFAPEGLALEIVSEIISMSKTENSTPTDKLKNLINRLEEERVDEERVSDGN